MCVIANWIKKNPKIKYKESDSIIEKLCKINGIEDIRSFLYPPESHLHDPYMLKNIEEAANTILSAANSGQKIAVSSDPDCDGEASSAIMYRFLLNFTDNVYLTYAERDAGHGIENQLQMIKPDTSLVIVCDSSTNSIDACKKLHESGIKVVILDHHLAETDDYSNPYAIVVNPQLDNSLNKSISGAGVIYKTLKVIEDSTGTDYADQYLDLVATGLVADVMSMREEENRYLVYNGLKNIVNPGLLAILKQSSVDPRNVNSQTIGYTIGPMLNGAARMGNIKLAIDLLTEDNPKMCANLAKEIKALNEQRKNIESDTFERIRSKINENDKVIFVIDNSIDKSFNGLIANKIATEYMRPALVLQENNGRLMGSFRSYGDLNIKEIFESFGDKVFTAGHTQAGGFGCDSDYLGTVRSRLNEALKDVTFDVVLEYCLEFNEKEVTEQMLEDIEKFSFVTGKDIEAPKFLIKSFFVTGADVIGSNRNTVKVTGSNMAALKFRTNEEFADIIDSFESYSIVGQVNLNRYYNFGKKQMVVTKQVFIDDIRKD